MTNQPQVSIVIPVFNAEQFIGETLSSLLSQDYPHLEIIAIDDGSTDGSLKILNEYKNRITIYSQRNSGQSSALNFGWSKSSGTYLGYLSSDDLLYPKAITHLVTSLENDSAAIAAYCDYHLIDAKSKVIRSIRSPEFDRCNLIESLVCPPGPGLLFRQKAFLTYGGWNPELRQMPDFEYWLRISDKGQFTKVPIVLAAFRIHESSQTFRPMPKKNANEPILVMTDFFQKNIFFTQSIKNKSLARSYILSAQWDLRSGRYSSGAVKYLTALKHSYKSTLTLQTFRGMVTSLLGRIYYRYFFKT